MQRDTFSSVITHFHVYYLKIINIYIVISVINDIECRSKSLQMKKKSSRGQIISENFHASFFLSMSVIFSF